ncbi:LRRN4 C-terminal-like protein isoform X2 [Narcine bancroftii]|uniref:LRRN4 C-terminal-like protein isoform X2 n=1 Tax=Narcine bancroftii TaxID=1343680 RepID=UPI003831D4A8
MEEVKTKMQKSEFSPGQCSAMLVLAVFFSVAIWKEASSASLSLGTTGQPVISEQQPDLNWSWGALVTRGSRTTRRGFIRFTLGGEDDYVDEEEEEEPTLPHPQLGPLNRCDYHPCAHMQVPCAELQKAQLCLCPGISGGDVLPEQPRIQQVTVTSDHQASVHWCEPPSVVSGYRLVFWPRGFSANVTTQLISDRHRVFTLRGLEAGTTYVVCALAFNPSGASLLAKQDQKGAEPGVGPCLAFTTTSVRRLVLYICIGLCLLLTLSLSCILLRCYCARRRDPPPPSSLALGLRNPTYEDDKSNLQVA